MADPNAFDIASVWLARLADAFRHKSLTSVLALIHSDGRLRDVLIFSWDTRCLHGAANIGKHLEAALHRVDITSLTLDEHPDLQPAFANAGAGDPSLVELAFRFETEIALGRGSAKLVREDDADGDGEWKAQVVLLMMDELKGYEEAGPDPGYVRTDPVYWGNVRSEERAAIESDPYVVVVGAGQTGLQVAARFRQMGIRTLVVDRAGRVGDQWRARYPSLVLHSPRSHHSLLYHPYPSNWPIWTPKDKLADWLGMYAVAQDLVVWTCTTISTSPRSLYDPITQRWTLTLLRGGSTVVLHPAHIVIATGTLGLPTMPTIPGAASFRGKIMHSSAFPTDPATSFRGLRALVVGTGNSGADLAQALAQRSAGTRGRVTMLQRGSTVLVTRAVNEAYYDYVHPAGQPVAIGDFRLAGTPLALVKEQIKKAGAGAGGGPVDAELRERMGKKGFRTGVGDGTGLFGMIFDKFGGYWIDSGCGELIASGKIAVKSGLTLDHLEPHSAVFSDGTRMDVELIVFATGYGDPREPLKEIFGAELIDKTKPMWGLDAEGEIPCYRPSGHPGFWYAGGDFYHPRWMSKHLALQVKARQLGLVQDLTAV